MGRRNTWTIELVEHGEFMSTDEQVQRNMKESKGYLALTIAECYGGGCGAASTKSYWFTHPKMTLAVVLAGLQYPLK
jgi:hypothetical protein